MKLKLYLQTFLIFFVIDAIWLTLISPDLYESEIGNLLGDPILLPAAIFYLAYPFALLELVLVPFTNKPIKEVVLKGALLGAIAYGTYDLTNMAVLKGWSPTITVIDIIWGSVLTGLTTYLVLTIAKRGK